MRGPQLLKYLFNRACHTGRAAPLRSIAAAVRTPHIEALDLARSQDLLCHNLLCEKVGQPCICRLAQVLELHAGSLRWLSLASNGLQQLPEALTSLAQLQYLDLSGNQLAALPEGFSRLRSLQVLDLSGNAPLTALPFAASDLPQLEELRVDACLEGVAAGMRECLQARRQS